MRIDQEERRREIARVAIGLIASEGLAAATIRRIAAEAGSSTTPITHHFDDKHELLVYTFGVLAEEGERRFREAVGADPADVMGALLTMVPWCPVNIRRWKAYLAFWDEAARNPELALMMRRSAQTGMELIGGLLKAPGRPGTNPETGAELLSRLVQGLALQMLVDVANWPMRRVTAALAQSYELAMTSAAAGHGRDRDYPGQSLAASVRIEDRFLGDAPLTARISGRKR